MSSIREALEQRERETLAAQAARSADSRGRLHPESEDDVEIDETVEDDDRDDEDSTIIADEEEGDEDVTDIIGNVSGDEET